MPENIVYNTDCMEFLRCCPDKAFGLAICDPPYFSGPEKRGYYGRSVSTTKVKRIQYPKSEKWECPGQEYFEELLRVSEDQIIFGINYFREGLALLGPGRIIWDKCNGMSTFSDAEIAYCSRQDSVRIYRYMWNGMCQGKSISEGNVQQGNKTLNETRIHPTQKPVNLYKWLLMRYAHPGEKILDTHVGSGSSRIACMDMGFDFVGCEIDQTYYELQEERFKEYLKQPFLIWR